MHRFSVPVNFPHHVALEVFMTLWQVCSWHHLPSNAPWLVWFCIVLSWPSVQQSQAASVDEASALETCRSLDMLGNRKKISASPKVSPKSVQGTKTFARLQFPAGSCCESSWQIRPVAHSSSKFLLFTAWETIENHGSPVLPALQTPHRGQQTRFLLH